ncbi:hypothetical protein KAT36_03140 [Candidatus Pacearchaeota archaeon]|nr:hypothetical protein [Candidatus Pacearchaeota archaeon]
MVQTMARIKRQGKNFEVLVDLDIDRFDVGILSKGKIEKLSGKELE